MLYNSKCVFYTTLMAVTLIDVGKLSKYIYLKLAFFNIVKLSTFFSLAVCKFDQVPAFAHNFVNLYAN